MLSSVAPTRSPTFNAYLITKIGNCNLKTGLYIVVRVAEHAYDNASCFKEDFKPSTSRLQIFPVRDQNLRSLLPHGDQTIAVHSLKNMFSSLCLRSLRLIWRPGFNQQK